MLRERSTRFWIKNAFTEGHYSLSDKDLRLSNAREHQPEIGRRRKQAFVRVAKFSYTARLAYPPDTVNLPNPLKPTFLLTSTAYNS